MGASRPTQLPEAPGWRLSFARGLIALSLGSALLVAGAGQSRLATFIGVYWLLGAVLTIRWISRSRGVPGRRMAAVAAAIGVIAGATMLAREPLDHVVGTGALLKIVGVAAIAIGAVRILGGFRDARHNRLVGGLDIALGLALVLASGATSPWIRFLGAAWGLVGGTLLLTDALRLRR